LIAVPFRRKVSVDNRETPMPLLDLLQSQLTDVFRIGLIIALVVTTLRTQTVTGTILPLLAGVVFVAVIIPMTMPTTEPALRAIGIGILANLILVAVAMAALQVYRRFKG
jgi:hypothetical protein